MNEEKSPADILVVDDAPENLHLLMHLLKKHHYKARAVESGLEALQSARLHPPALVLLDVLMPEMNGYDTCTQLKANPATQDIPVIFLSALDTAQDKMAAFEAGGVDYITKPFQEEEVLARIATHLQLHAMQQQLKDKNQQLERQIAERQRAEAQSQLLNELSMAILGAPTPESIAGIAATRLRQMLACQRITVFEFRTDDAPKILVTETVGDFDANFVEREHKFDMGQFTRRDYIPDLSAVVARTPFQEQLFTEGMRAYVSIPLPFQQYLIGALCLEADQPHVFSPAAIEMATQVAIILAIGIHQARAALNLQQEVTERQQAQAALQAYAEELEISNAELDAFAHTVAHDLKNPLAALMGFGHLLRKNVADLPPEAIQESAETIVRAGQKIGSIINELLLLARVRKLETIPCAPLDMAAIVAEACARLEAMFDEYHAVLTLPEHWPVAIGYAPWIEEVWVNYLSNALKYGGRPEEGIAPCIVVGCDATKGDGARFWVQDNGPGLLAEEQTQLFTQFTRLHQRDAEGHGLGLSIVQRIVIRLGGQVGVESTAGQGSRFYFTLPADLEEAC